MEKSNFTIEKARPADAGWIAGFQVQMARESEDLALDPETVRRGVENIFREPARGFYLAARDPGGAPLACLLIQREWSDWRNAEVWWMHSVYTVPAWRKKGVFRKMFEYVEALARENGIAGIRLYVDQQNRWALQVYRRLGMSGDHYALFEKMLDE